MSLRILLFIESGGPGGAERVVLDLARSYRERGHFVSVLTLRSGWLTEQLLAAGVELLQLSAADQSRSALPFSLALLLHKGGYQILHSHLLDSNFYGALAARLAGCPHIATEHGDVHHTQPKKFLRAKLRIISLLGSRFTAVSRFTAKRLAQLGVPPERINVVGNPVAAVPPNAAVRQETRSLLRVGEQDWLWLHVANLRPVKDQQTLLRGYAEALRSNPAQRLCILGDGPERSSLFALGRELGLAPEQIFLGFHDVTPFLQAADGFVLTSLSEALPMSLLEAAAAGLALVSSAAGGIPEVVVPGISGYLFPPQNPGALAGVLREAAADPEASRRLGAAARAFAASRFSPARVAESYERLCSGEGLRTFNSG